MERRTVRTGACRSGTILYLSPPPFVNQEEMRIVSDEHDLHARALVAPEGPDALALWIELAARGNPDAPERLRAYARCDQGSLRDPAREALEDLGLSHDEPMP